MTSHPKPPLEGWHGWDDYAPFYDWENAQTMGRRDVAFWQNLARRTGGPALELGCGTGRVALPVARTGIRLVGADRSSEMLARARQRRRRSKTASSLALVRADIRRLPFARPGRFALVIAAYGILQSLLADADLDATLSSVAEVIRPGGTFGIDLVADLPKWQEYSRRVRLSGRLGAGRRHVTLVESVRQDRERKWTIFDQEYLERRRGGVERRQFSLAFRTLTVPEMIDRLEPAGFRVTAVLGDYDGRPWDSRAETWIILATRS
jgi:ubiquinone/menaquinone biosynthesis C-methylase UbiE